MNKILKRLEIIKNSIAIEEDEIIELQIMKLKKLDIDNETKEILSLLEELKYSKALENIEKYLSKYSGIAKYIDPQIQSLKLELKALEQKHHKLIQTKQEYLNDIDEFNIVYNLKLGALIEEILKLEKEKLYSKYVQKQDELKEKRKILKEIKKNISELNSTIDEFENMLSEIDEDDEHYDKIYSTYKELQNEVEKLENQVKQEKPNDIRKEEIYTKYYEAKSSYEEYKNQYRNNMSYKEMLLLKTKEFKKDISALNTEIEELKQDETYRLIQNIDDWDEYFDSLKNELETRLMMLNKNINDIDNTKNTPQKIITKEQSQYAQILKDMVVPTFAKIIKTANNSDDELSRFLSKNGKIYKALYYSAFENLFDVIQTNTIDIVDWNCGRGLVSSLLIDYIREKQIDIKVKNISLVEKNTTQLQRALLHIETLKEYDINISTDEIITKNITIHLFSDLHNENDFVKDKIKLSNSDNYMVFVSEDDDIDTTYDIFDGDIISNKDGKVGRFKRYEKIIKI